jgi:hypothetical protein
MPPGCVVSVIAMDRDSDELAAPPLMAREVDQ